MAKEKFESRVLIGDVNVACKYENGVVKYWTDSKQNIIRHIIQIVQEYSAAGYVLTLRQLHYQLVTNNWIVNHTTAYQKLSSILDDCRYAGLIDWDAIEDRGRQPYIPVSFDDTVDGMTALKRQYRIDRQQGQKYYVELWTEKDALSGILKRSTEKYHIQLVVNKGYTSSSAAYNAYQRLVAMILLGVKVKVLYFGDHDPSGLDMIRDIRERLLFFLCNGNMLRTAKFKLIVDKWWKDKGYTLHDLADRHLLSNKCIRWLNKSDDRGYDEVATALLKFYLTDNDFFEVIPIGLTMVQIKKYDLPPNPAKISDPRADAYIKKFGEISWEVDALKPQVLTSIVEANIENWLDMGLYMAQMKKEAKDIQQLEKIIATEAKRLKKVK